jgi:polyisoprenoid-binding protein YceI
MATYRIVPERSEVQIAATSSLHPIHTRARGLEGFLELDVLQGGRVNVQRPARAEVSFPVQHLSSGNPLEDRELKRRIDARRFPSIDGVLGELRATDRDGRYLARGDLTFRGVTNSHEDEVTIEQVDARTLRLVGEHTFDIREFGMDPPRILMFRVEPKVKVSVEIVAATDEGAIAS